MGARKGLRLFRRRLHRLRVATSEVEERLIELTKAPLASVPLEQDLPEAMRFALQLNHPVYDCFYLALAKRLGTYVVTADARFGQAVSSHGAHIEQIRVVAELGCQRPMLL